MMDELRQGLRAKCVEQAAAAFDALIVWEEEHGEARLLEIEEVIERLRVPITQALMDAALTLRRAAEMGAAVPVCAECGEPMHYKGRKKKRIVTTAGEVDWERSHYYCKGCRGGVFPPGPEVRDWEGGVE